MNVGEVEAMIGERWFRGFAIDTLDGEAKHCGEIVHEVGAWLCVYRIFHGIS